MDFSLEDEQHELVALAARIFRDKASPERVAAVEAGADRVDGELWNTLARAGLLGVGIPEAYGGGGGGLVDLCLVLREQGRHVAPVPLWQTLALGALPITVHGTEEQRERWLPAVAAGEAMLTAAALETPLRAVDERSHVHVTGQLSSVPAAHVAQRVLVPVAMPDVGDCLVMLDPTADGVERVDAVGINRQIFSHLTLRDVRIEPGDVIVTSSLDRIRDSALVALCAGQVGVAEQALRLLAGYTSERIQFGRPVGSFQGVSIRAADAYIDAEIMRLTMLQAGWRLDSGLPAGAHVAAAKWWASEGGHRVVHAAQHLHGGMGNDVEYPLHRYFLWGKQNDVLLGGAAEHLARLGRMISDSDVVAGGD